MAVSSMQRYPNAYNGMYAQICEPDAQREVFCSKHAEPAQPCLMNLFIVAL